MKRNIIVVLALVGVMVFSLAASAGWKLGAEQGVDAGIVSSYLLDTYVGWDFNAPYIDMGPISVSGDFVVTRSYDWAISALSGVLGFDGELTFGYVDDFDVIVSTSASIDYAPLPLSIDLLSWDFGVEFVGYLNPVWTLNAGVLFKYVNTSGTDVFNTSFYVGFDAEW